MEKGVKDKIFCYFFNLKVDFDEMSFFYTAQRFNFKLPVTPGITPIALNLGPGSHSRVNFGLQRESRINVPAPEGWMRSVEQSGHGIRTSKLLDITDSLGELLVTGYIRDVYCAKYYGRGGGG